MVTPEWLAANWWLLAIIALAVGFFLGWLIIGRPARNRAEEAESSVARAESNTKSVEVKLKDAEKSIATARQREQELQGNLSKGAGRFDAGYCPAQRRAAGSDRRVGMN